ncbi:MAG: beta-galactosidase [Terriglobia bacterium]|jgi:hypothetical protein
MESSRRNFLLTAFTAPLAARLDGWGHGRLQALAAALPAAGQLQFENPHIIRYDASCFTINGRDTIVVSGAFHYPRCPKSLWSDRLRKFKLAGFNTIETYVFWNYHEPAEGKLNLAQFEEFVKLVHQMGFFLIVRPGPYVCAEWERGGFPSWIAAKRFPLRTPHPESLRTSQHWYEEVLPIIQKHQVMVGGPIIMVQVENEYDFSPPMPDADKREYVRALAQMVWNAGISVPVITCWTKQARENTDPDMARIMDTCNFYPRWKIVAELTPALEKLRKEEPASPVAITELQGGWFSEFGGKLSVDQDGVDAAQINMVTKTAIELGVTYYNYYMGFGGTNFDWAAKRLTTTYDYAAPISEPGGLWDKYYAARGICQSLRVFGNVLARAQAVEGVQSTNANVSVSERVNGPSAVVFVRENANAPQRYKMTFTDPNSPSKRKIIAPREGELELGAREMKMLPVQIPIGGGKLCYSTAEVLAHGVNLDRDFLILYDAPGRVAEIGLATEKEPKLEGDTVYRYWDPEYESSVFGVQVGKNEKMLLYDEHLQLLVLPRDKALRTFIWEFPPKIVPGSEEQKPVAAPIITDAYSLAGSGTEKSRAWVDVEFLPGQHEVAVMLPPLPGKCRVDGIVTDFQYDRPWHTARLHVTTPAVPYSPVNLSEGNAWVEKFDPGAGQWLTSPPRALEDLGPVPYGYVKYRAQFNFAGEPKMFIATLADDAKKVFVNGKLVADASNAKKQVDFLLANYAQPGNNLLEISYELFGAPNGGENLGELKGIESVRIGADRSSARSLESWQIQRFAPPMRGREVDPEFGAWAPASFLGGAANQSAVSAFTWCRAEFEPPTPAEGWTVPWKLVFDADCDALIYLNGKFVGRYVTIGPQKEFYLPEPYLSPAGRQNLLSFVLAYTDQPQHLRALRVAPYLEFSVRRTRVEFEW